MRHLKIGILSTPLIECPPKTYGGLERVNYDLCNALSQMGHKVILYAPTGSVKPEKAYLYETGNPTGLKCNWLQEEQNMWDKVKHTFGDLDIIHGSNWFGMEYASKREHPEYKCCHTHHGGMDMNWWGNPPFKLNIISISKWMEKVYESQNCKARYVYNGIDLDLYPYKENHGERLMFLGRIDPIKAPHVAIQVAEQTKTPIDIVGGTSFVQDMNYVQQIKTACERSPYANFVGEVDHATKMKYLQEAKALLIPSQFGEPFGLVVIEALACGTPTIALNDGALGEIITPDVGAVCNSVGELKQAVNRIDTFSPQDCRKRAEVFSKERCAEAYLERYKQVLDGDEW